MKGDTLPLATDEDGDSVQKKKQASAKERMMAKEREARLAKLAEWKVSFRCPSLSLSLCVCVCFSSLFFSFSVCVLTPKVYV